MNYLPNECLLNIFCYLEPLHLLQVSTVSEQWNQLIKYVLSKRMKVSIHQHLEEKIYLSKRYKVTKIEILRMLKMFGPSVKSVSVKFLDSYDDNQKRSIVVSLGPHRYYNENELLMSNVVCEITKHSEQIESIDIEYGCKLELFYNCHSELMTLIRLSSKLKAFKLSLSDSPLEGFKVDELFNFEEVPFNMLEKFSIENAEFEDVTVIISLFQRMKNLTSLKIVAGNLIQTSVITAVTQHLPQLKSLFLSEVVGYNDWNSFVSEEALMSISNLKNLEELHFDGMFLPVNNRTVSEITSNCRNIERLEFHSTIISESILKNATENLNNLKVLVLNEVYRLSSLIPPTNSLNLKTLTLGIDSYTFDFSCLIEIVEKLPLLSVLEVTSRSTVSLTVIHQIVSIAVARDQYVILRKTELANQTEEKSSRESEDHTLMIFSSGKLSPKSDPSFRFHCDRTPANLFGGIEYYVKKHLTSCRVISFNNNKFKVQVEKWAI